MGNTLTNIDDAGILLTFVGLIVSVLDLLDLWHLKRRLDDLIRYSFLHEVDLTLPYDLHKVVWNRNGEFALSA